MGAVAGLERGEEDFSVGVEGTASQPKDSKVDDPKMVLTVPPLLTAASRSHPRVRVGLQD